MPDQLTIGEYEELHDRTLGPHHGRTLDLTMVGLPDLFEKINEILFIRYTRAARLHDTHGDLQHQTACWSKPSPGKQSVRLSCRGIQDNPRN